MSRIVMVLLVAVALVAAACGDSVQTSIGPPATVAPTTEAAVTTVTVAPTTATVAPTTLAPTTTAALPETTTTTASGPAIQVGEPDASGVSEVTVDGAALAPLFNSFTPGDDPFYLIHTQQDDLFIGVEMYTVFGAGWTGELGTFPADCTTHGICVYLDPDGTGPLTGGGPGVGEITVTRLEGGTMVTLDDITIMAETGEAYHLGGLTLSG